MADKAGPQGTGLVPGTPAAPPVPPMAGFGEGSDDDDDDVGAITPPAGSVEGQPPAGDVIDSAPPVVDGGGDDDDDDAGGTDGDPDIEAMIDSKLESFADTIQRRFDKAISRAGRKQTPQEPAGGTDDDDSDDEKPPARRQSAPAIDVRAIKVLINDAIEEHPKLEKAGRSERRAVKTILHRVAPLVDWGTVDDEEETIETLIGTVIEQAGVLVKTGSDRKVAQLRGAGLIPPVAGQPGGTPSNGSGTPLATSMTKGSEEAKRRWPEGKRRFGN